MKTLDEALQIVLAATRPLGVEAVLLEDSANRFLAEDLRAEIMLPPFDQSAMDGYAVRAADVGVGGGLKVVGEQAAGASSNISVGIGEAVRIFTGARLPDGADAVVMQEDARREGNEVFFSETAEPGEFVRRAGEEVCAGQILAKRGTLISAAMMGLLASQGKTNLPIACRPRVAILSTGDELTARELPLKPGKIYESNGVMLSAAVAALGGAVINLGIAGDEAAPLATKLQQGLKSDVLVISGGVSVGDRDLVKAELQALGATQHLWRVAMKPGKPFLFATHGGCLIFGLPGNPVASLVSWLLLVRPALLKMMGASALDLPNFPAAMSQPYRNAGDRPEFVRGNLTGGAFTPTGRQESHALFGLSKANALVRVEPGQELTAGAKVTALLFA